MVLASPQCVVDTGPLLPPQAGHVCGVNSEISVSLCWIIGWTFPSLNFPSGKWVLSLACHLLLFARGRNSPVTAQFHMGVQPSPPRPTEPASHQTLSEQTNLKRTCTPVSTCPLILAHWHMALADKTMHCTLHFRGKLESSVRPQPQRPWCFHPPSSQP